MISDYARLAWNKMCARLGIGLTVTLDHRDLEWLFQISSGAVAWHESQGQAAPEIVTRIEDAGKKRRKGKGKKP